MPTLMQKIRLALRGWNRRRQERDRDFLAKNTWGTAAPVPVARTTEPVSVSMDIEGLTVAYLDGSGRAHYLDTETGDVIEATNMALDSARYKSIPNASHEEVRLIFITSVEDPAQRDRLSAVESFRAALAGDHKLERAWYNVRNDRALGAIKAWLSKLGLG